MRRQPFTVFKPTAGIDISYDPILIADDASPSIENFRFERGLLVKTGSWKQWVPSNLPLDAPVVFIDSFPMRSGTIHAIVATTYDIYVYNPTTNTLDMKYESAGSGDSFHYSATITIDSAGNEIYVITNGSNLLKWDGSLGSDFEYLDGLPNIDCKYVIGYKNRLVLGYTYESGSYNPYRIRWSTAGNPENWTGPGSGFMDLSESSDFITGLIPLKDSIMIVRERSIWELVYVGGTRVFDVVRRLDGIGSFAPNTIVTLGDTILFLGNDNVYLYDKHNLEPIANSIAPEIFTVDRGKVNLSKIDRARGVFLEELYEYKMTLPMLGEDIPTLEYTYNFVTKSWSSKTLETTAWGYYNYSYSEAWKDQVERWYEATAIWNVERGPSGAPVTLRGTKDGYIYIDDRLTYDNSPAWFQTKDWMFAHSMRLTGAIIHAKGGPFVVESSFDGGNTWENPQVFGWSTDWKDNFYWMNKTVQKVRFKIYTEAERLEVKWIEPWHIKRQRPI